MQMSEALLIRLWHARELDIVRTVCNIDVIAMKRSSLVMRGSGCDSQCLPNKVTALTRFCCHSSPSVDKWRKICIGSVKPRYFGEFRLLS